MRDELKAFGRATGSQKTKHGNPYQSPLPGREKPAKKIGIKHKHLRNFSKEKLTKLQKSFK